MKRTTGRFKKQIFILSLVLVTYSLSLYSQTVSTDNSFEKTGSGEQILLFDSDEILKITIATGLSRLTGDIKENPDYHQAILSFVQSGNDTISLNVKIKTRGNYRRSRANCDFPPLLINFKKKEVKNTIFQGQNKIKLVTHCRTGDPEYEQLLYKEYLVYKLYNLITPYSLRVRLIDLTYVDIWNPDNVVRKHSFLVETPEAMAERNDAKDKDVVNIREEEVNQFYFTQLALFQYMVINNDWSLPLMKNIKLVSPGDANRMIPVPFDFDFSGFVNAPYRFTEEPEDDVYSDRRYKGPPNSKPEMDKHFEYFKSKRREIYDLVGDFEPLARKNKTIANKMLNDFYKVVDQPETCDCGFYFDAQNE